MFGNIFYHRMLKKGVKAFGTLFNNITVLRYNKDGSESKRFKIPLVYGPRERYLVRKTTEEIIDRGYNITHPGMSFRIVSMAYNSHKKLITMHKNSINREDTNASVNRVFNPVFYNLGMELTVTSQLIDDSNQIIEQILPKFTPDFTVTLISIPEINLRDDIPITLESVNFTENFEDDWVNRQEIVWTLNFNMKLPFYGPIKTEKVVTKAQVDTLTVPTEEDLHDKKVREKTPRDGRVIIEPDPSDAFRGDDFGYSSEIEFFEDGKKYNPVSGEDEDIEE